MAIDPKLVSIIPASQLPTGNPTNAADFLFYEGNELKKGSMSNIYDKVTSGIKGVATQTNAATVYTPETYPNGLTEIWRVFDPLTSPNSWGNIAVTQAELSANDIYFVVTNGTVAKKTSPKTVADPAKLPLYSAIKSANIAAGTQFIDDENGNVQYRVKTGQTLLTTEIPANVIGVKVERIGADDPVNDKVINITYANLQSGVLTNVGAEQVSAAWKRTDFVPIKLNDSIEYALQTVSDNNAIFLYDANKVFLRKFLPATTTPQIFTGTFVNTYSDAKFMRVHTLADTHPNYQPLTFKFIKTSKSLFNELNEKTVSNATKIDGLKTLLDQSTVIPFSAFEPGLLLNTGATQDSTQWARTGFLPIEINDIVNFTLQTPTGNNTLFLYDENKVFKRALYPNSSAGWQLMSGSWVNTYDDVNFVRTHTLGTTHPDYQPIAFNFEVINKGQVPNIITKTEDNAAKIAEIKAEDLEQKLAHLLISRDEQIAKIEAGDYGVIVNGNDFVTGTQTERLKSAIAFIKKMGKGVLELTQDTVTNSFIWDMSESLLMPSNFTLLIRDGVTLRKQNGIFDTLLRNDGIVPNPSAPYGKASQLNQNENIHIILADTAYVNDLDIPKNAPHPIDGGANVDWERDYFGWRTLTLLFANCKNYSVKGGNFNNGRCWSISNESGCENFVYDGIDFRTYMINGDGIDIRTGCKNFVIKNITGATVDDLVAMSCVGLSSEISLPMQVGGYLYMQNENYEPSIENGIVYNIEGFSVTHLVIVLCSGANTKINNIKIGKIKQNLLMETVDIGQPFLSTVEIFTGYFTPYATMGQMTNIYVNDVTNINAPQGAIRIDIPLKDAHFNNLNSVSTIPTVSYSTNYVEGTNVFVTNVKQNATL